MRETDKTIETMKQALEALEEAHIKPEHKQDEHKRERAITALRAAIAEASGQDVQQEIEQEPVAWGVDWDSKGACCTIVKRYGHGVDEILAVEYAPPKREPLTEEEISKIFIYCGRDKETFARAIERAHGIGGEE